MNYYESRKKFRSIFFGTWNYPWKLKKVTVRKLIHRATFTQFNPTMCPLNLQLFFQTPAVSKPDIGTQYLEVTFIAHPSLLIHKIPFIQH